MMYFIYDGENSADYNVFISGEGTYATPDKRVETVSVAGRNGELIIEDEYYSNITITYPAFIRENLTTRLRDFAAMLSSRTGYVRLEDTYHPEEFRMAHYEKGFNPQTSPYNAAGKFDIEFNCMPQRFLKLGEKTTTFTDDGTIINPTLFSSKPILRVYGTGTLTIEGQSIVISSADGYTDIDCEIMEAYKGSVNCNANVTLPDNIYLYAGSNSITLTDITEVEITPNWWTI